ncbi:MAG: four helix bundle protein [Candidatus Zapsychrus exili]|nr:four helix bundle protein [Candidatus Zapsychrus exili]
MRNFKNIKAYELSDKLVIKIYKVVKTFPKEEIYGLTSQLKRASVSVPSNIAEGASRQHKKDYLNFLYIARGSLSETEYLLSLSLKLNYLSDLKYNELEETRKDAAKTLYGLINAVSKEIQKGH